ncbi:GNAT family N-acetyltransferase [Shewanella sp. TC10]|uniref:GNAT family N-acetyltransferase n=1 Tax=Shewanella sp. TC10 TaxID=1419739 RepID=UPI001E54BE7F|nr:GNAT family N-acetyltransferase [Shewanella sp. TC10]
MNYQDMQCLFETLFKQTDCDEYLTLNFNIPDVDAFTSLRIDAGWWLIDSALAKVSLDNSLFHVGIYNHDKLLAYGRVIGDGALFYYVQDVVVLTEYQGRGLGHFIMLAIGSFLDTAVTKGATVGLLSVKGKEPFYLRYGFKPRDGSELGLGMCKFY